LTVMTKTDETDGFGAANLVGSSYPGKITNHLGSMSRGWFQDVSQYVGMAFDRQNAQVVHVLCHEQQGVFEWKLTSTHACNNACNNTHGTNQICASN
jgi:hypothetical protein